MKKFLITIFAILLATSAYAAPWKISKGQTVRVSVQENPRVVGTALDILKKDFLNVLDASVQVCDTQQADIVITGNGGYPMDQNIYQSVKSMAAGEAVCRPGGVLIIAASCSDGHGGEAFYQTLSKMRSPAELLENISKVPRNQTEPDQWQYQIFARILQKHRVIIVSRDCSSELIKAMHLDAADSLENALEKAYAITNRDAAVAVIPDGVSVIAEKADF